MNTYTLQRTRPVALGLLDAVPVSLAVLVVVGMARRQHNQHCSTQLRYHGSGRTHFLDLAMATSCVGLEEYGCCGFPYRRSSCLE